MTPATITPRLKSNSLPSEQPRLPESYYRRSSLYGYTHTLPDLVLFWALLLGIGLLAWPWKLLCAAVLTVVAYRMTFIMHDCSHGTLFARKWENEVFGWLTCSCLLTAFPEFRRLHWIHHQRYREEGDTQGTDYNGLNPTRDHVLWHLVKPLFLFNLVEKISLYIAMLHSDAKRSDLRGDRSQAPARVRILPAIALAQVAIVAASTAAGQFLWGYPIFLLIVGCFVLFLSRVRSYLEHGAIEGDTPDSLRVARTHLSNFLERNILCSLSFNYHNEHHRWPQVPACRLADVHRNITRDQLPHHDYSPSYFASLIRLVLSVFGPKPARQELHPFPHAPEIATEEVPCGLCGSRESQFYAESYDYEYQSCSNRWKFVQCLKCRNVYLNPRPVREALPIIYPTTYYAYNYAKVMNPISQRLKALVDARRFAAIRRQIKGEIHAYLDIGCGNGRYLYAMAATGLPRSQIYGIELDAAVTERLRAEGFQAQHCPFEEARDLPRGTFQLITLFSVLEHLSSPQETLERAYDLLAPGGMLVFEVPNVKSDNGWLFRKNYWGGYHTPRHWNLFSLDTVKQVCEPMGYGVIRLDRTTGHAFWLWSTHHYVRYALGWDRLGKLLDPCRCLLGVLLVTPIDMIRAWLGYETDNMVVFLKKQERAAQTIPPAAAA
jgi:fatty acid desaturase/SAM-dependent methyltransferase